MALRIVEMVGTASEKTVTFSDGKKFIAVITHAIGKQYVVLLNEDFTAAWRLPKREKLVVEYLDNEARK